MKKTLLLTGVLLALGASLASAAPGLSLGWAVSTAENTCPSSPTSTLNRQFLCNSNSGADVIIGSVVAPAGLSNVVGELVILDMQEAAPALSDWWNFSLACRTTPSSSLSFNTAFDPLNDEGLCNNLWQLYSSGATNYQAGVPTPDRAKLAGAFAVAVSNGRPYPAGSEWYCFRVVIDHRHTITGTLPICQGCLDGTAWAFNHLELNQPAGTPGGDYATDQAASPGPGQCVTWRGGVGPSGTLVCPGATPTRRATWGQVKTLYR